MTVNEIVEKIFEYDNYRFFLKDYFEKQKQICSTFSHRSFAKKAGFSSPSFFSHIIDGKRNLTENSLGKMIKGVSLKGRKSTFFYNLVQYNQAETIEKRELFYSKLNKLRRGSELFALNQKQWSYYDNWYNPVIRELAPCKEWGGDFKKLGELVTPVITPEKAKRSVELLLDINMLVKDGTAYSQSHTTVTSINIPAAVTRKMRREFIQLAEQAMDNLPIDKRLIAGVTVTLSHKQYGIVEEKLNEIRQLILNEGIGDAEETGKVYQINFQAYPLSDEITLNSRGNDNV